MLYSQVDSINNQTLSGLIIGSVSVFVVCITVRFRVIVFRPFVDEILVGKIRSCSSDGVRGT